MSRLDTPNEWDSAQSAHQTRELYLNESAREQDLVRCIQALCDGDYTVCPEHDDPLSQALKKLIQQLSSHVQDEMTHVVKLSVQANETAIFSAQMLSNLNKMDTFAQSIAAAAEEMNATVQQIGDYGTQIASQAQEAQKVTDLGASAARESVKRMGEIAQSVQDGSKKVGALSEFSEEIGKIAEDIKKIADQTNFLAINATIEAARAGESGKGFAVVAGEVKKLSEQIKSSTDEINNITEHLQKESREIVSSMQRSKDVVTRGQESIDQVAARMESIQDKISDVTSNTSNIAHTLSEQRQASIEVSNGITEIAGNSTKSVQGIERIVDAMDVVEQLITAQMKYMTDFNVPNKVIKLAQSDHVLWKKRLANMIAGREGLKPDELADHHTCRLGQWYDKVTDPKYIESKLFQSLVRPHKMVHMSGIQAVRFFNSGHTEEALQEIQKVEDASREVLRILKELESL